MPTSVDFARAVISGEVRPTVAEGLLHAKALKDDGKFDLAWRVLAAVAVVKGEPDYAEVKQEMALATYKDKDLPSPHRLHAALDILNDALDLATTTDAETLGQAGAIYKLLWQDGGQRVHIEKSYALYYSAHLLAPVDDGYVSVNAAYMLDVLASQEAAGMQPLAPISAERRFDEAAKIREELIAQLVAQGGPKRPKSHPWWYWASLAEAALGLGRYDDVERWLGEGMKTAPRVWMLESTSRQMAATALIQHDRKGNVRGRAYDVLQRALGVSNDAVESVFVGRIGVALSGGGFRASLYHIGVLAKLAELDVLRRVEVLSCVSGGSIIGAHYYLALKKRLEAKYDATNAPAGTPLTSIMSQQDYIEIVQEVERTFLEGVQRNIRTRMLGSSLFASLKMAVLPGYTRTSRTGELYERELYARVDGVRARSMNELLIKPCGYAKVSDFKPAEENWKRNAKVPVLVLNATALNTGHNWQFTSTWMGESPQAIGKAIDAIPRLRRMYYGTPADNRDNIPAKWQSVRLGDAVGASAAVPGIFEPIVIDKLFPDHTVRLADGGVHDNQGLASLIEQSCKVILVSDSSGQMQKDAYPEGGVTPVVGRTNSILQARVREAQYADLQTRHRSRAIDGMMFIHLTKDLEAEPVSWIGAKDAWLTKQPADDYTSYGIDRRIQVQLAEVRTDLDSFSDAEAYALMTSGYLMTEHAFEKERCAPTIHIGAKPAVHWRFLGAREALTNVKSSDNERMRRLLAVSKELTLKAWRQAKVLKGLAVGLGVIALFAVVILFYVKWKNPILATGFPIPRYWEVAAAIGALVLALALRYGTDKLLHVQKRFGELFLGLGLIAAFPVIWLHLLIFDPIFLWIGEWKDAPPPPTPAAIAAPGPHLQIKATPAAPPIPAQPERRRPMVHRMLRAIWPRG